MFVLFQRLGGNSGEFGVAGEGRLLVLGALWQQMGLLRTEKPRKIPFLSFCFEKTYFLFSSQQSTELG